MTPRDNFLRTLRRQSPTRVPFAVQLAPRKHEEFVQRTGQSDAYEFFRLPYRHVGTVPPQRLPDLGRYFKGRVPDWPDLSAPGHRLDAFAGNPHYFSMGPNRTAMNEWGEYRIYGDDLDYHRKICPLDLDDITLSDIEAYPYPDLFAPSRYAGIDEQIRVTKGRDLASVLSWEMTIFEKAWRIRGLERLLTDMVDAPAMVEALFDRIAARTGFLAAKYAAAGVDVIQLGDDIGSQQGMLISPELWRLHLKPRLAGIIANIKQANPETLVFYHSDGVISPVIDELIDIGVDILNPVQPECMDVVEVKRRYGRRLSFWGGLGVQTVLPFGSPSDVKNAVRKLIDDVARDGGWVVAPCHLIERDVPWQNLEAFLETMETYG